jgi:hypothetical protein
MKTDARTIFYIMIVLSVLFLGLLFAVLPQQVAAHFSFSGAVDRTMAKPDFLGVQGALVVAFAVLFPGIARMLRRAPVEQINLPNKEYWLHGGRGRWARARLQAMLYWIGTLTLGLVVVSNAFVYLVSTGALPDRVPGLIVLIGLFLLALGVLIFLFLRPFYRPRSSS